uniref:Uncharacterized protein n=1 Tax=Heterorhabditis bacteriophora TaxID=37862 RepID=A0A1I7WY52_HETBA
MLFSPLLVIYTTRPPYYLSRAIGKQQKKSPDSKRVTIDCALGALGTFGYLDS